MLKIFKHKYEQSTLLKEIYIYYKIVHIDLLYKDLIVTIVLIKKLIIQKVLLLF